MGGGQLAIWQNEARKLNIFNPGAPLFRAPTGCVRPPDRIGSAAIFPQAERVTTHGEVET
jgi:hypothetical protein